ncbi:putative ribonuclease H-like domain-containing protein [Tanacetum coccineum]
MSMVGLKGEYVGCVEAIQEEDGAASSSCEFERLPKCIGVGHSRRETGLASDIHFNALCLVPSYLSVCLFPIPGRAQKGNPSIKRSKLNRSYARRASAVQVTTGIEAIRLFLAYALFKDFVVYQMDVKSAFLYGKIKDEVYLAQTSRDANAEDVDVHLYRSMIGSLMYLTVFRHDKCLVVCDYADSKSHLKKSYNQRLLISWEAKLIHCNASEANVVANYCYEAKYVAAASCCRQVLWIQNQILDYGYNFMNTKILLGQSKHQAPSA